MNILIAMPSASYHQMLRSLYSLAPHLLAFDFWLPIFLLSSQLLNACRTNSVEQTHHPSWICVLPGTVLCSLRLLFPPETLSNLSHFSQAPVLLSSLLRSANDLASYFFKKIKLCAFHFVLPASHVTPWIYCLLLSMVESDGSFQQH